MLVEVGERNPIAPLVIVRLFDEPIVFVIPAKYFGIVAFPSCWLTLCIEKGDLNHIALQIIRVGDFCISLFVFGGLIDNIEVRLFNLFALQIIFTSCLDMALI